MYMTRAARARFTQLPDRALRLALCSTVGVRSALWQGQLILCQGSRVVTDASSTCGSPVVTAASICSYILQDLR